MKPPDRSEWRIFFQRLPRWIVPLILILLFGRFVLVALFHLLTR